MTDWAPIDTAPNDLRAFLACDKYGQQWLCCRSEDGKVMAYAENVQTLFAGADATHWQPLPPPPPPHR